MQSGDPEEIKRYSRSLSLIMNVGIIDFHLSLLVGTVTLQTYTCRYCCSLTWFLCSMKQLGVLLNPPNVLVACLFQGYTQYFITGAH